MSKATEALEHMREEISGIVCSALLDIDGIPLCVSGEFDLPIDDLGAMLAASYQVFMNIGADLGDDKLEDITVNYRNLKLTQLQMPRGSLVVIVEKDAPMPVVKLEAKRAIRIFDKLMDETLDERSRLMESYKLEKPNQPNESSSMGTDLIAMLERGASDENLR